MFAIQGGIDDRLNNPGAGPVEIVKNQFFVTPAAEASAPGAIERAMNIAAGDTVNIAPGTYPGPLDVTQDSSLVGAGASAVTISGAGPVVSVASGVTASLDGLTISGGSAANGGGVDNAGRLTILDSAIDNNSATGNGGGIENEAGGTLCISDSTVANNMAGGLGGGIDNQGRLTIVNSTVADNSAAAGGGISDEGPLTAVNATVAYNSTSGGLDSGGGLDVTGAGTATLDNAIVALDTDASGGDDVGGTGIASTSSNNLVGVDDTGTVGASVSPFVVGRANPGLASGLAYNGGPTQTIAVASSTSPALNNGSNSWAAAYVVTTDQRGATRGPDGGLNAGTVVDIGSYEASSSYLVTSASDATDTGTFQAAVAWANLNTNVNAANLAEPAPNTVGFVTNGTFSSPQTIGFFRGSSALDVSNSAGEVIQGPGANLVTIEAYGARGVFQISSGVTATIIGLAISGGSNDGIENMGSLTVAGCEITNDGTGIDNAGTLTVAGCEITNDGTGIDNAGTLAVTDSTIAYDSPGIDNELGSTLNLTNSTITLNGGANQSPAGSGGIDNFGTLTAVNTTIADNQGGGLDDEPECTPATLYNTIVALNQMAAPLTYAATYGDISGEVSSASSYNLIGPGGSGGLTGADGHHNQVDVLDPGLASVPFQIVTWSGNKGGPTRTIALLPGSPAIKAGSVALASQYGLATDQRGAGFPRVINGAVDIGAFESPVFGSPTVYTVTSTSNDASVAGSLPWAINQANNQGNPGYSPANPAGSQVTFAIPTSDPHYDASTHSWTITLSSTLELFEEDGLEVIQGPGANALTVSGNHTVNVFSVDGNTAATISGLTISGGTDSNAFLGGAAGGGGIFNNGTLTVRACVVSGNSAPNSANGGGIMNQNILTVADSKIEGNNGAINGGGILNDWVMTVSDSEIDSNSADYPGGGGEGGGIFNVVGVATIIDSTIAGNTGGAFGGGVGNAGASLRVIGSVIADNSAGTAGTPAGSGGGLYASGSMQITDSTIANNTANVGGGIFVNSGALMITDSTIAGNTATSPLPSWLPPSAGSGGGLWDPGVEARFAGVPAILDNSIVADNVGPSGLDDIAGGALSPSSAYNLVGVDNTGSLTNGVNGNVVGPQYNPMLGPLQNNGGPTETMALLPGSPALGKGDPADTNADQRGAPVDSPPDIGAFQSQGFNVTADITNPTYSSGQVGLTASAVDGPGGNQGASFIYNIDWGDGTALNPDITSVPRSAGNGSGVPLSHTYASPGVYMVSLTAVDEGLEVSPPATAVIVVSSTPEDSISLSGGTTAGQVVISTDTPPAAVYTPTDLVFVAGEGGSDTYTVNFGSTLTTPITIAGSGGTDTLVVNGDSSSTNVINKTPGSVTWGSPVTETITRSGIPNTTINANGTSQNYVNDPGGNTTINGGPGANTVVITASSGNGVVINGGPSTNSYVVDLGSLAGPVTINNSNATASNSLVVNGAAGNNAITASGDQVVSGTQTITDTTALTNLTVNGGSGSNQVTVSTLTVPVQSLALNGGGTSNTITLNNVGSSVGSVAVTPGSSSGTTQVQVNGTPPAIVTTQDVLPVVSAGSNTSVNEGATLRGSGSFADSSTSATYLATVNYGDGTATQALYLTNETFALSHVYGKGGTYTVTVTVSDGRNGVGTGSFVVTVLNVPPSVGAISGAAQVVPGQTVALTASFTDPGFLETHTATFSWGDNTTSAGTVTESNGSGSVAGSHVYATTGSYTVTLSVTDSEGASSTPVNFQETVTQSDILLDATAGGALTISGNGSINIPGTLVVDSSSTSALSASGNATVKASSIQLVGKVQKSGNATLSPSPVTGAAVVLDPLANITGPSTTGLTNYGAVTVTGNSAQTLSPGTFTQITISSNASVTLNAGVYVIKGGGFTVSGNATVKGTGVVIYNAGSSYPNAGGTYGAISLSGNGAINLAAPATGTYAGLVFVQPSANAKALSTSGNAIALSGTVFAPSAQLNLSGNAQLNAAVVVDTMTISGNGVSNTVTLSSPTGTVAYTPAQIRAAYGISALALDGTGQTIAIVDAYDDPDIYQAVDAFDSQFGLTATGSTLYAQYGPASSFLSVLNQYGQATNLPSTDPNGAGTDNWEVEEALDVEWVHAIAPGAQIILVEANSQSLPDLMASVATAAAQPGVSVVSMSWGFAEGQAVFASDEGKYDSVFNVPGVTFVASTGDYGAADPEYPAYSPNVVAVGGTSLALNADNSYNSETGWGYYSSAAGAMIASGGGISLYEPEPAYQDGVQSTGCRSTPDVSLVADPATGAWIADPYNLDPSDPFEIVGGTSLSAPAWAGLLAVVNQGRAAAGESTLNSTSPTDTQQALYMLPQSDYNTIASGTNGYSAGAGYNLVTGLGTPVANLLVPDLIKYQGPGTSYAGSTVAGLQNAGLVNTGTSDGGPMDVFSVFNSLTVAINGLGGAQDQVSITGLSSPLNQTPPPAGAGRTAASPLITAGISFGPASNLSPAGLTPLPPAGFTITPSSTGLMSPQPAWVTAQPMANTPTRSEHDVFLQRTDHDNEPGPFVTRHRSGLVLDSVLNELASDRVGRMGAGGRRTEERPIPDFFRAVSSAHRPSGERGVPGTIGALAVDWGGVADPEIRTGPMSRQDPPRQSGAREASLTDILLAAGFCSFGAGIRGQRNSRAGRLHFRRKSRFLADQHGTRGRRDH
ncbi:MAG: choice-of-anchor Q domain-containing protein [Isosphaerales bacterium]